MRRRRNGRALINAEAALVLLINLCALAVAAVAAVEIARFLGWSP
jgi:hypothetical protein